MDQASKSVYGHCRGGGGVLACEQVWENVPFASFFFFLFSFFFFFFLSGNQLAHTSSTKGQDQSSDGIRTHDFPIHFPKR